LCERRPDLDAGENCPYFCCTAIYMFRDLGIRAA
jgi:hypothetical protein